MADAVTKLISDLLTLPDGCQKLTIEIRDSKRTVADLVYTPIEDTYDYCGNNIPSRLKENVLKHALSICGKPKVICRYDFDSDHVLFSPLYISYVYVNSIQITERCHVYNFDIPILLQNYPEPVIFEPPKLVRQIAYYKYM